MIIYNVKLNKKLILKVCLSIMATICICITVMSIYNLFFAKTSSMNLIDDSIPSSEPAEIISSNYTNILKQVHNNLDTYVGQKISFTGYVYRLKNFSIDQFVLARDMDIGNNQTLIVGFLCESQDIKNYQDQTWVKIEGEITARRLIRQLELLGVDKKPNNPKYKVLQIGIYSIFHAPPLLS